MHKAIIDDETKALITKLHLEDGLAPWAINERLSEQYNVKISTSTIRRMLREWGSYNKLITLNDLRSDPRRKSKMRKTYSLEKWTSDDGSTGFNIRESTETAYIYKISLTDDSLSGECYVGSTTMSLEVRLYVHVVRLERNDHPSPKLQEVWNKYGMEKFRIELLESCRVEDRFEREQFYMDKLNSCYNGSKFSQVTRDSEIREKISQKMQDHRTVTPPTDSQIEAWRENAAIARESSPANKPGWIPTHRIGTTHTDETKSKMREARLQVLQEKRASGELAEIGRKISESKKAQDRGTRAKAVLAIMPKDEWLTTQQIADKCPFGRDNAYLALKQLEKEGKVVMGITSPRLALWKPT